MKKTSLEEFNNWLKDPEYYHLEFKEAKNSFSKDRDLPDYCAALANSNGGVLILGANNKGKVVGTKAFEGTYNTLPHQLLNKLKINIIVEELRHPDGRVVIFHIPRRPIGQRVRSTGHYKYPMRSGESLVEMDDETTRSILNETESDFSAEIVRSLRIDDLDDKAIHNFTLRWAQKTGRQEFINFSKEQILHSIRLLSDQGLNYAALILFGKEEKIDELLPASEIIFEWRQDAARTPHDYRQTWRKPYFIAHDEIWAAIQARNLRIPIQDGLFQLEINAFNEKAVREALNNAVAHRDYSITAQSIIIKASPQEFAIESPGGFPPGITPENILDKSYWRNRCIAEVFEKAQLVERSGQGMNDIFESSIREGKGLPNFSGSDTRSVVLHIPAQVKDKKFILFLEKVADEKQMSFSFEEIYELEKIREHQRLKNIVHKEKFMQAGLIEKVGRTSGVQYILSHRYYISEGRAGIYTKLTGLSREKQKELIIKHIKKNGRGIMREFRDVFPELKVMDISNLLQELKRAGIIEPAGRVWRIIKEK